MLQVEMKGLIVFMAAELIELVNVHCDHVNAEDSKKVSNVAEDLIDSFDLNAELKKTVRYKLGLPLDGLEG